MFDMEEHNRLLESTREEVAIIREKQAKAQRKMLAYEEDLMKKWMKEREKGKVSRDEVQDLASGEHSPPLQSIPFRLSGRRKY